MAPGVDTDEPHVRGATCFVHETRADDYGESDWRILNMIRVLNLNKTDLV